MSLSVERRTAFKQLKHSTPTFHAGLPTQCSNAPCVLRSYTQPSPLGLTQLSRFLCLGKKRIRPHSTTVVHSISKSSRHKSPRGCGLLDAPIPISAESDRTLKIHPAKNN